MLLKNEFEIEADLDSTWALLTDLERVMPCMPGATLQGRDGDSYLGSVKVKVGPIGANFAGSASFAEKDDATHSAVIAAAGKDPRGQATADARIHARLEPITATRTRVLVDTDLDITGKMAQFGRGAIADVSNRLLGQFVGNIGALLEAPSSGPAPAAASAPPPGTQPTAAPGSTASATTTQRPPEADADLDVMSLVLPMIKERYGQALLGGLLGFLLSWVVFGRRAAR